MRLPSRLTKLMRKYRVGGAVSAGVLLVGVPAFFTVFSEAAKGGLLPRVLVGVVWLLVATGAILSAVQRDLRVEALTEERLEFRRQLRAAGFADVMTALTNLEWTDLPAGWELTVYSYDNQEGLLRPMFPAWEQGGPDLREFEPGKGATGTAWKKGGLAVVKGEAVSDQEYGLRPDQQLLWHDYKRAVATPIFSDDAAKIGVLTALSKEEDDFFDSYSGQASLKVLANTMAVVLLTMAPEYVAPPS